MANQAELVGQHRLRGVPDALNFKNLVQARQIAQLRQLATPLPPLPILPGPPIFELAASMRNRNNGDSGFNYTERPVKVDRARPRATRTRFPGQPSRYIQDTMAGFATFDAEDVQQVVANRARGKRETSNVPVLDFTVFDL